MSDRPPVTTERVVWRNRTYTLTVLDAANRQAYWQEPGSPVKRHPSEMPRGLNRAWREQQRANQAAPEAPPGP